MVVGRGVACLPTAYAVGYSLSPLRGYSTSTTLSRNEPGYYRYFVALKLLIATFRAYSRRNW